MSVPGAIAPPPGVTPHFHGPMNDKQKQVATAASVNMALSTLFLVLRLYTRGIIVRSFGSDDCLCCIVRLSFFPCGFGKHFWDIPVTELHPFLQLIGTIAIVYVWATTMPKISLLLLYHRLTPDKTFRLAIYVLMFIITAFTISHTIIVAAGCSPLDSSKSGCLNTLSFAAAVINIICYGFVMILPLPLVWSLQLPHRQKIGLGLLFAGGSLVIIASIIRVRLAKALQGKKDISFAEGDIGIWSLVEINVGVICNCLVVMKPFFRRHLGNILGSSGADSHNSPYSFNIGSVFSRFKKQQREPRSYRLTSLDRSGRPGDSELQMPQSTQRSITVSHTYEVTANRGEFDTESTEDMMKSAGHERAGKDLV
ncbi:uncharacterized protein BDZ99DRAFT_494414 [Mytilinidion resinicola]|uniref:Rhodopsin domain-containing protein n=1 Tax=Mytilinidion resinicola TaxID=574789 RepID=A0A6A6Z728_9PEZI|nr:uncharacterized protein BDZ99DRAFT_494414 [Mytilinidion resinicola]KAF2816618.1 hypothetical protein BDZ99DRAFT_494414 [Mytilinidion resinicola]